MVTVQHRVDSA